VRCGRKDNKGEAHEHVSEILLAKQIANNLLFYRTVHLLSGADLLGVEN
jgi:hypothetical protein